MRPKPLGCFSFQITRPAQFRLVIGPLLDSVTWYKIAHAGTPVQNKATRTSPPCPAFVLEVPLCNLRPSMCDFVPCDRIVQKAYCSFQITDVLWRIVFLINSHSFPRQFDLLMNKQLSRVTSRDMKYDSKQTSRISIIN